MSFSVVPVLCKQVLRVVFADQARWRARRFGRCPADLEESDSPPQTLRNMLGMSADDLIYRLSPQERTPRLRSNRRPSRTVPSRLSTLCVAYDAQEEGQLPR